MQRQILTVSIIFSLVLIVACTGSSGKDDSNDSPNSALEINGTPASSVTVGQLYRFEPTVTAPQGTPLTFSIDNPPSWTAFDLDSGALVGTPTVDDIGAHSDIQITVSGGGDSASLAVFSITVSPTPPPGASFSFIVFGDLNRGGCQRNDRVNRQVQNIAEHEADAAFYISTGDIVDGDWTTENKTACYASDPVMHNAEAGCDDGVPNGNMAEILSPLKNRAPAPGLASSFYMAIGNHDDSWGSGWYPDPCGQGICQFLAPLTPGDLIKHPFDEANICGLQQEQSSFSNEFYYSFAYNNSYFIVLRLNNDDWNMLSCNNLPATYSDCAQYCADPTLIDDTSRNNRCYNIQQFDWLRSELEAASNQQYAHIFVFAHAPLVTSGDDHRPTFGHQQIRALLEAYGVDIYFNGHNHAYERTHPLQDDQIDTSGTVYITTGSGGGSSSGVNGDWFTAADAGDFAQYGEPDYGDKMTTYLKITVNGQSVSGEVSSLGIPDAPVDQFALEVNGSADAKVQNIGGCSIFPNDNMWNTPIDQLALDPKSDDYINSIGSATPIHPDFGTVWNDADIGIPFDVIPDNQPFVDVSFLYDDETDPLDLDSRIKPYPLPDNPTIEGGSDNHVLLVRQDSCILYELFNVEKDTDGSWTAGSGAIWDLNQNQVRPEGVTSADAAGLAILPGLVRYEEVFGDPENNIEAGIHHALRITLSQVQRGYIRPASHSDGQAGSDPDYPPMGLRLRLKAEVDISGFDTSIQVILTAMKKYGVVIADTGSDMYLSGVHDDRWDDDQLRQLGTITTADFEAVYTGPIIPY